MSSTEALLRALAPLTSRVRTDVTAMKNEHGMLWTREPLTESRLVKHLEGGAARGVCPIKAGESTTRVALLDMDSHKGQTSWPVMVDHLARAAALLEADGMKPVAFRSSGGLGVHLFLVWDEPQDAFSVRHYLRSVLIALGLKDGAKGVAAGEVEVFPKQDSVPVNGFGNQFILPLAGRSAPLEPLADYEVMPREYAAELDWAASAPVPVAERPVRVVNTAESVEHGELASALAAIPNDGDGLGYDDWRNVIVSIHAATGGSDEGYDLAYAFSARSDKFEESELRDKVWGWADSDKPGGITGGTVLRMAREAGWNDTPAEAFAPVAPLGDGEPVEDGPRVLDPKNTMLLARAYLRGEHTKAGHAALLRSGGLWYSHGETCWNEEADDVVRHGAWTFLDKACKEVTTVDKETKKKHTRIEPFLPTMAQITSTVDALKAVAHVKGVTSPCWLPGYGLGPTPPDPRDIVSMQDGLLHIPTRELLPHSAGFFSLNSLPFAWGGAGKPVEWLKFLDGVWGEDWEAKAALQEMFGYLLTADTSQQKMFLIRGPKRSGKGTIARVLGALVGRDNMVSPTLTSMTKDFGLQPLIGKLVAMIPDARVGAQTNKQAVVERLLMLSGEDSITVDRKNIASWTGTLSSRVVIMTNESPQLGDASGALAGRFINISMSRSFFGVEDLGLTARLLKELPGIFRWALDGRDRLKERGHFVQPASAAEDAQELAEANSPISTFVEDCMDLGADYSVPLSEAFEAWRTWCGQNAWTNCGTKQTFGKSLRAAFAEIHVWRPREGEDRPRHLKNIRVKPHIRAQLCLF